MQSKQEKALNTLLLNITHNFQLLATKYNVSEADKKKFLNNTIKKLQKKPARKKTKLSEDEICQARKQDGLQCSRRRKKGELYCGKHIHNRPYGRYDNKPDIANKDKIKVKNITIEDIEYFIDNNNILYSISGDKIIGRLMNNGEVYFV